MENLLTPLLASMQECETKIVLIEPALSPFQPLSVFTAEKFAELQAGHEGVVGLKVTKTYKGPMLYRVDEFNTGVL